jgi:transposase
MKRAADVFDGGAGPRCRAGGELVGHKTLHAKIGRLALENDFLSGALIKAGMLSAKK